MTIKTTNGFTQRHNNDVAGLTWVYKFKWLRSVELGRLLWPKDTYSRTRVDRVIRGWIARDLVIERQLPAGAGRAVVLASAGVRLLAVAKVAAKTGKDFGETGANGWRPNAKWRHDLIAAGVLTHLHEDGYAIIPEPQIRRENPKLGKIPDGIAWKSGIVYCIEVEQSTKKGPYQKALAEAICVVSEGTHEPISGHKPTAALVAFDIDAHDTRDMRINHPIRIKEAIQRVSVRDVKLTWAACTLAGHGVSAVQELEIEIVPSDLASRIEQILHKSGWVKDENDIYRATYGDYTFEVSDEPEQAGGWVAIVDGKSIFEAVDTKAQAQRACADFLAARPSRKK